MSELIPLYLERPASPALSVDIWLPPQVGKKKGVRGRVLHMLLLHNPKLHACL